MIVAAAKECIKKRVHSLAVFLPYRKDRIFHQKAIDKNFGK